MKISDSPIAKCFALLMSGELKYFISQTQISCLMEGLRGEEGGAFVDIVNALLLTIQTMPKIREQDGKGRDATVYLHYFAGGMDWYITEKDFFVKDDLPEVRGQQHQAFGCADIYDDGGELGYISIQELIQNNVQLDFHWTPQTINEIYAKKS